MSQRISEVFEQTSARPVYLEQSFPGRRRVLIDDVADGKGGREARREERRRRIPMHSPTVQVPRVHDWKMLGKPLCWFGAARGPSYHPLFHCHASTGYPLPEKEDPKDIFVTILRWEPAMRSLVDVGDVFVSQSLTVVRGREGRGRYAL